MTRQQRIFWDTIAAMSDLGVLKHLVVIGSWCEHVYEVSGCYHGLKSNMRTQDVDFLIPNIRCPANSVDLPKKLEELGYVASFNRANNLITFDKDGQIEVEFLVRELSKGQLGAYKVPSMGVTAQGLRYLDIISKNTVALASNGHIVNVPKLDVYILHKLLINSVRSEHKAKKDIQAIVYLSEQLENNDEFRKSLSGSLKTLHKNEIRKIMETIEKRELRGFFKFLDS